MSTTVVLVLTDVSVAVNIFNHWECPSSFPEQRVLRWLHLPRIRYNVNMWYIHEYWRGTIRLLYLGGFTVNFARLPDLYLVNYWTFFHILLQASGSLCLELSTQSVDLLNHWRKSWYLYLTGILHLFRVCILQQMSTVARRFKRSTRSAYEVSLLN